MEVGIRRGNLGRGSTTTNGSVRPTTKRNPGQQADANQNVVTNAGAGNPPVDMGMMYQFFINLMQAGAVVGVVGNVRGSNLVALIRNNYTTLTRDYTSLHGKPFVGIKNAIEVENWLLHYERIFHGLGLGDE